MMIDAYDWNAVDARKIADALFRSDWYETQPFRNRIIEVALHQEATALCGAAAASKYGFNEGEEWCSEFARTVLVQAGGPRDLGSVTGVSDFESFFRDIGGWTVAKYMTQFELHPGDYIALNTHGDKGNHSGIVVGVSNDYTHIYTVEGNVSDCVKFKKRDFFIDGKISSEIYGRGNVDKF